jgi:hypothetical protein
VNLRSFDSILWRTTESPLDQIQACLQRVRHYPVITGRMERVLAKADPVIMRACFLNSDRKGLYRPN